MTSMITPLSPVDIPGCVMWVTPDTLQPASTGLAAGSPLTDVTGYNTLTQASGTAQPTVGFPLLAGRMAFQWNGSTQYYDLGNTSNGPIYRLQSGSYSFAFAFNSGVSDGSYRCFLSKSNGGDSRILFTFNALKFYRNNNLVTPKLQASTPYVVVYVYQKLTASTGNEYFYVNGLLVAKNLAISMPSVDSTHSVQIGAYNAGGSGFLLQDTYDICAWDSALTTSQINSVSNYLLKQMGFLVNLVTDGNSLVLGTGASVTSLGHATLLSKMLEASVFVNMGLGGRRFIPPQASSAGEGLVQHILTTGTTQYTGPFASLLSSPACDFNLLIAWEATNAFWRDNASVATNISDTISYFSLARQFGYQLGTCTAPYMGNTWETKRVQYNSWMRSNWPSFADFLIDYGGDRLLNQPDSAGTGQYNPFIGSGYPHPNNLGHARMAQIACRDTMSYMQKKLATKTQ